MWIKKACRFFSKTCAALACVSIVPWSIVEAVEPLPQTTQDASAYANKMVSDIAQSPHCQVFREEILARGKGSSTNGKTIGSIAATRQKALMAGCMVPTVANGAVSSEKIGGGAVKSGSVSLSEVKLAEPPVNSVAPFAAVIGASNTIIAPGVPVKPEVSATSVNKELNAYGVRMAAQIQDTPMCVKFKQIIKDQYKGVPYTAENFRVISQAKEDAQTAQCLK